MIITKSLNSYHFYHRGYVCSVGPALKLSLDNYSKSKKLLPILESYCKDIDLFLENRKFCAKNG